MLHLVQNLGPNWELVSDVLRFNAQLKVLQALVVARVGDAKMLSRSDFASSWCLRTCAHF